MSRETLQPQPADTLTSAVASGSRARCRVLFLVPTLHTGGAERVVATLARRLDRSRFEVHLGALDVSGSYSQDLPPDVALHVFRKRRMFLAWPSIVALVRRIRPDVVLSTLIETNVTTLLARPFFPKSTSIIVRETLNPSPMLAEVLPLPSVWRSMYKHLYPNADAIVCQSQAMKTDVLRYVPVEGSRVRLIFNGVDVELLKTRAAESNPYPSAGPNLVSAGRLEDQKDFPILLQAFALIRQAFPSARLFLL